MNRKRLYKQSGELHPRGVKVVAGVQQKICELFSNYSRYHPRDLQLMIVDGARLAADVSVIEGSKRKPPKL